LQLPTEAIWIDLLNPTDEDKAFVEKRSGFHVPSIEAQARELEDTLTGWRI
jgi:magnesium transporter